MNKTSHRLLNHKTTQVTNLRQWGSFILGFTAIIFSSCAGSYNFIVPRTLNYTNKTEYEGVEMLYRYNVQKEIGNKKYARKERKKNTKLVAIKFTNNTEIDIRFSELEFYSDNEQLQPLPFAETHKRLKQSVPIYFLYFLLTPINGMGLDKNGKATKFVPIGVIAGPSLGLLNIASAKSANKKFHLELMRNDLSNALIAKGETVHALVAFEGLQNDVALTIKTKNTTAKKLTEDE